MTKEEAIEVMKAGQKVTHNYFDAHEWITIENGTIVSEDGVKHIEFWRIRCQDYWSDGWSIFKYEDKIERL